jgi:hypothetical protein
VHLLAELPWQCWILPGLLVAVWLLLWAAPVRRRTRMWYAGLAPVVSVAAIVIGVVTMFGGGGDTVGDHCAESRPCGGGGQAAHWAYALNSVSGVGLVIVANALLAAALALPLLVITAAVELPRMAADREAASLAAQH